MNWTTKLVRNWLEDPKAVERDMKLINLLNDGEDITVEPYTNVDIFGESYRLRSSSIVLNHTTEELEDIVRNKTLPEMMNGILPQSREYQFEMLRQIQSNKMNVLSCARQIGSTSVLATYVTHYLANSWDKSIMFVTKDVRGATHKIMKAIQNCPYHRQSGIRKVNENNDTEPAVVRMSAVISFENGCTIRVFDMSKLLVSPDLLIVDGIQFYGLDLIAGTFPGLIARTNTKIVLAGLPDREGNFETVFDWARKRNDKNPGSTAIGSWDWKTHWVEHEQDIRSHITTEQWFMEYELLVPGTQEWRDKMLETILR
jgi:hypothetical protein